LNFPDYEETAARPVRLVHVVAVVLGEDQPETDNAE
jgi:hypothetical protein